MILIVALALVMSAEGTIRNSLPILAVLALGAQRLMPLVQSIYNGWSSVVGNYPVLISVVELLQMPVPRRFEDRVPRDGWRSKSISGPTA